MDRLIQIEAFVAAVDQGSLTKAARDQNVTPAMIGTTHRRLWRNGSASSFCIDRLAISALTEEGANYAAECRRILSDLDETEEVS